MNEELKDRILAAFREASKDPQKAQEVMREALRTESGQDTAGEPPQDQEPTDDELMAAFEDARRGEGQVPLLEDDDAGTDPSEADEDALDEQLWEAYQRSWKGEDA